MRLSHNDWMLLKERHGLISVWIRRDDWMLLLKQQRLVSVWVRRDQCVVPRMAEVTRELGLVALHRRLLRDRQSNQDLAERYGNVGHRACRLEALLVTMMRRSDRR